MMSFNNRNEFIMEYNFYILNKKNKTNIYIYIYKTLERPCLLIMMKIKTYDQKENFLKEFQFIRYIYIYI